MEGLPPWVQITSSPDQDSIIPVMPQLLTGLPGEMGVQGSIENRELNGLIGDTFSGFVTTAPLFDISPCRPLVDAKTQDGNSEQYTAVIEVSYNLAAMIANNLFMRFTSGAGGAVKQTTMCLIDGVAGYAFPMRGSQFKVELLRATGIGIAAGLPAQLTVKAFMVKGINGLLPWHYWFFNVPLAAGANTDPLQTTLVAPGMPPIPPETQEIMVIPNQALPFSLIHFEPGPVIWDKYTFAAGEKIWIPFQDRPYLAIRNDAMVQQTFDLFLKLGQ